MTEKKPNMDKRKDQDLRKLLENQTELQETDLSKVSGGSYTQQKRQDGSGGGNTTAKYDLAQQKV